MGYCVISILNQEYTFAYGFSGNTFQILVGDKGSEGV